MNILVVGGAGYIGSCFCEMFAKDMKSTDKIIILDDFSTGHAESVHPKAQLYKGSVLDYEIVEKIFISHKIDFVFHFAAKLVVGESVFQPIEYFENNVGGVIVLLKLMKKYNVSNIIFSSTAAVYGNPETVPVDENSYKNPINPYGDSKLACENLIVASEKAYGINYGILRYFNVAGASESGQYGLRKKDPTLLIPVINKSNINNSSFKVFGNDYDTVDKTWIRDYINISDLVDAHILLFKYIIKNKKSAILNLGTEKGSSVLEIIKETEKVLNKKVNYEIVARREGDPAKLITKSELAKEILGWTPKRTLSQTIKTDYEFRLKNSNFSK